MKHIVMTTAVLCCCTALAVGQGVNTRSAGDRMIDGLKRQNSAEELRMNTVDRDRQVRGGLGVPTVAAPRSAPSAAPRSAPSAAPSSASPSRSLTPRVAVPSVNQAAAPAPPRRQSASFGVGSGPTTKPFSNISTAPTVSPYLGLFNEGFDSYNDLNYQTIVRPQLQQQQFNQQVVREAQALNRRLTNIAAQNPYTNEASQRAIMPTGHAATFGYHSRFYPQRSRQQARRR